MKFSDILALAKNGYSPKDIKDLMALADPDEPDQKQEPEDKQEPEQKQEPEDKQEPDQKQEPEQKQEPDQKQEQPEDKDAKIIDLEKKIAELQKLNTTKDLSDKKPKSDDDIFKELMREFM